MREILFRGKRVDNGEWVEGFYVNVPEHYKQEMSGKSYIVSINNGLFMEVVHETVGEYTGLKDTDGSMIFEGDIVQGEAAEARGVIEWQQAEAGYLVNDRNGYEWLFMDDDGWRVIGNIHDNPELLEVEE